MDGLQLRDEAVRDRIRLAEEFLDRSEWPQAEVHNQTDSSRRSTYRKACTSARIPIVVI